MKQGIRLIALSSALAVNAAALFVTHVALVDGAGRERLAPQEVERVVITGERPADALASKNCTGRQAL
jgi:hypothetical protein